MSDPAFVGEVQVTIKLQNAKNSSKLPALEVYHICSILKQNTSDCVLNNSSEDYLLILLCSLLYVLSSFAETPTIL